MEYRRRQFLTSPGETLLLPTKAMHIVERLTNLSRNSGLGAEAIVSSPLVAVPVPRRAPGQRWPASTEPSLLWNPLFWLPERLAAPPAGADEDALDVWAISVALEVTLSGLYDVESGTWLDVLSTVGLDIDDPVTQARITEWLEGAADPQLDSIDLSDGLDIDEPDWSRIHAEGILPLLRPASWAVLSNDLIDTASDVLADPDVTVDELAEAARHIVYIAQGAISDGPGPVEGEQPPTVLWQRVIDDIPHWPARGVDGVLDGPFDALVESLYTIRNDYWVFVDALWEEHRNQQVPGDDRASA